MPKIRLALSLLLTIAFGGACGPNSTAKKCESDAVCTTGEICEE